MIDIREIQETVAMIHEENLDIRTITMGISLFDCQSDDICRLCERIYDKITKSAEHLTEVSSALERRYGIPIINSRVSVTPISYMAGGIRSEDDCVKLAKTLDRAADTLGINFIGGYSALVQKGATDSALLLIKSIPYALSETSLVCSSVNVASTKAGINMDAVREMGEIIKKNRVSHARQRLNRMCKACRFLKRAGGQPVHGGRFSRRGRG